MDLVKLYAQASVQRIQHCGDECPEQSRMLLLFMTTTFFDGLNKAKELSELKKYECYEHVATNLTYEAVKHKIYLTETGCYYYKPIYYYQEPYREHGTLSYFLFGSGKGNKVRYEKEIYNYK